MHLAVGLSQIAIGVAHNCVFGPKRAYPITGDGFWFYASGGALWLVGAQSIVVALEPSPSLPAMASTLLANIGILFLAMLFWRDRGRSGRPQAVALIATSLIALAATLVLLAER